MPFKAQGNTKERTRNAQQSTKQRKESTRKAQVASWPRCCFADASPLPRGPAVASWPRCCLGAASWCCCGLAVALLWPRCGLSGLSVALPWHRRGLAVPKLVVFLVCFPAEIKSTIRSDVMMQTGSALGGTQQPCDARGFSFLDCDPGPKLVPEE